MRISPKSLLISLALVMALATLITFLGVYDSDKMPFGERLLFWACTIGAGLGTAGFAAQWETIALLRKKSVALQLTVLSAVSSLPVLLVLFAFDTGFKRGWPITLWIY